MDETKDERTILREREREPDVENVFRITRISSLSFLFIILSRSFVFVKVWSVKKYSSNNRLLKKKLPRYIVEKEAKKRKKERKGERREKIVLKRKKFERNLWKDKFLGVWKSCARSRDRNESTSVTGTLFFRHSRVTRRCNRWIVRIPFHRVDPRTHARTPRHFHRRDRRFGE